ncbi:copper homeostasis protein CutC [Croceivirga radicis]|uniref:PF03932 family protein CutC n=1 Tax=Croceivirga radicis TaxID=1929488 RepID=A0A1V6LUP8_9FLAO|nr:copper homeostasis protein CutC [Croceivirga radicis]OQD43726.1 copper homeostasis protein CutC [Croceivirga radicis]
MLVEVCANSLTSAIRAMNANADRIELCSELGVGGVTPSAGMLKTVMQAVSIPVHVLVRPRSAHFTYTKDEFKVLQADIDFCLSLGVKGIVSGALTRDNDLDIQKTRELVKQCQGTAFTFHRAFDWLTEPEKDLAVLEDIGVHTVLTSGKHLSAVNALDKLVKWQSKTAITIMAGGGVSADNAQLFKNAGLRAIHLSGSGFENSISVNRKIPMNATKHLAEHHVAYSQLKTIKEVIDAVK